MLAHRSAADTSTPRPLLLILALVLTAALLVASATPIRAVGPALLVTQINWGTDHADIGEITAVGNMIYFHATDGYSGTELWISDGTATGTRLVRDISWGQESSQISNLLNINGVLYFTVRNPLTFGATLWRSNASLSDVYPIKDFSATSCCASPHELTSVGNTLFFVSADGMSSPDLWRSDGTSAGTEVVFDHDAVYGEAPIKLTPFNGKLLYAAATSEAGRELWRSDGTTAGTQMLKDINLSGSSIDGGDVRPVVVGNTLFFTARDATTGSELWKTDGTAAGTVLVKDIRSGASSSSPQELVHINGSLFFTADDGIHGSELWKSDAHPDCDRHRDSDPHTDQHADCHADQHVHPDAHVHAD